jgi:hypothetical protein
MPLHLGNKSERLDCAVGNFKAHFCMWEIHKDRHAGRSFFAQNPENLPIAFQIMVASRVSSASSVFLLVNPVAACRWPLFGQNVRFVLIKAWYSA